MIASVVVHVLVGGALILLRPHVSLSANRTIVVELHRREPEPTPPPKVVQPIATAPKAPTPTPPPRPPPRPMVRPEIHPPVVQPSMPTPQPTQPPVQPTPQPASPARKPDLFAPSALGAVVSNNGTGTFAVPDSGGRTVSAAHGARDPNQRDPTEDRERAAASLQGMVRDAQDRERLASGRVPPRWREAERNAFASFHPAADTVTDEESFKNFLKNWANTTPQGGTTPRGLDDSASSSFLGTGAAGSTASDVPEHLRKRAEVEVVMAADGSILSAKLVRRSGRRKFDKEALDTVVAAVTKSGRQEGDGAVVTRWAVEAWVNVAPPTAGGGFSFDEVTGKVSANHPMKRSVQTKVALISFRPRDVQ